MDEGAGLENQWALYESRGFESHSLRAVRLQASLTEFGSALRALGQTPDACHALHGAVRP